MWKELNQLRNKYIEQDLQKALNYEKFCMISIIYHSTKIEGCSLSETDTKVLIENDITSAGKPLSDHLMVKDHYDAFVYIRNEAQNKRNFDLKLIQNANAMVMKNTGGITKTILGDYDTSKGDLRLSQVYVDKKYFPNFIKVPELLSQFFENINERINKVKGIDILKLSADVHYNLVNIHPFGDGNGRTSRLLMNYIQLYHGEPLIKIFTEDRAEYIDALNETEEKQDINIFRNFICQQHIKFYRAELEKYEKLNSKTLLM